MDGSAGTALLLLRRNQTPPLPPLRPLLPFAAALVIPDAFSPADNFMPGLGDGKRIWSSSLRVANDHDKRRMLDEYVKRPYTHFVYDCAGWIYHDDYGYAADDPRAVRADLELLRRYRLVPIVAACNDEGRGSTVPWQSFTANADLIPICFPMWEQNGPQGVAVRQPDGTYTGPLIDTIRNTALAAPDAKMYLHFTAGHGAPGYPDERGSWRYVRDAFGVRGLFSQDEGYVRDPETGDPEGTGAGLQDTAERLGQEGLENVAFEQCTYACYNKDVQAKWVGWNEAQQREYGSRLQQLAPKTKGFCDGRL